MIVGWCRADSMGENYLRRLSLALPALILSTGVALNSGANYPCLLSNIAPIIVVGCDICPVVLFDALPSSCYCSCMHEGKRHCSLSKIEVKMGLLS